MVDGDDLDAEISTKLVLSYLDRQETHYYELVSAGTSLIALASLKLCPLLFLWGRLI